MEVTLAYIRIDSHPFLILAKVFFATYERNIALPPRVERSCVPFGFIKCKYVRCHVMHLSSIASRSGVSECNRNYNLHSLIRIGDTNSVGRSEIQLSRVPIREVKGPERRPERND